MHHVLSMYIMYVYITCKLCGYIGNFCLNCCACSKWYICGRLLLIGHSPLCVYTCVDVEKWLHVHIGNREPGIHILCTWLYMWASASVVVVMVTKTKNQKITLRYIYTCTKRWTFRLLMCIRCVVFTFLCTIVSILLFGYMCTCMHVHVAFGWA